MNDPSTWAENSICQSKSLTLPQQKQAKLKFKPFLVRSAIMQGPLTLFYLLLMMFQSCNPNLQKKQQRLESNPCITFLPWCSHPVLCKWHDTFFVSYFAYLVLPDTRSCYAKLYLLSNASTSKPPSIKTNGPIHVLVKTICIVTAFASVVETAGIFIGAQEAVPILNTLIHNILAAQVCMKWSKAIDIQYHWIKDIIEHGTFELKKIMEMDIPSTFCWSTICLSTICLVKHNLLKQLHLLEHHLLEHLLLEHHLLQHHGLAHQHSPCLSHVRVCWSVLTYFRPWSHVITRHGKFSPVNT